MKTVYPDYYKDFKCTAEKCSHNCCIGWEIDIDSDTYARYSAIKGDFGKRLQQSIGLSPTPHFVLKDDERCPFLNEQNLCDIFTSLGEDCLCQICRDHPRFLNFLEDRVECGLGLCCEEAARLIITKVAPTSFTKSNKNQCEILHLRDKAIAILQNRRKPISERTTEMLSLFSLKLSQKTVAQWAELYLSLERLDDNWTSKLLKLKSDFKKLTDSDLNAFNLYMKDRQTEYEQLLVYFAYRHISKAVSIYEAGLYAAFSVLSYEIIYAIGAVEYCRTGDFSVAEQIEIAREYSSEIEYSDENIDLILDALEE